jgi:glucose-1-phosphate adenylyltransferase
MRPASSGPVTPTTGALLASACTAVLAGGRGTRFCELTDTRAKPAVPFGGSWRLIDFTLSNCFNSGLRHVKVLAQYQSHSLARHIARAWTFSSPFQADSVETVTAREPAAGGYSGTADAVHQNIDILRAMAPERVVVLAGDHLYKMNYGAMLEEHVRRDADVTVGCVDVPVDRACELGVVRLDEDGRIRAFCEKPGRAESTSGTPGWTVASMGIYVFRAEMLWRELARDAADPQSCHDFGRDLLPALVGRARVFAHHFSGYWRDVGSPGAYWSAHMDLLGQAPRLDVVDPAWPIRGDASSAAGVRWVPAASGEGGTVEDSLLCGGGVVCGGHVRRSVLHPGFTIGEGSTVEASVVLPGVTVGRQVVLQRVVVDEGCILPDGIGIGIHPGEDRARFNVTAEGITLVTARMLAAAP